MKLSKIARMILLCAAFTFSPTGASAQGTVNFTNFAPPLVDAPFFDIDGTTRMSGQYWSAILYAGPDAGSLAPVGPAVSFLTGEEAGYFAGGSRTIDSVIPGATAFVSVRVWQHVTASSWETASCRGESGPFSVTTGGAGEPPGLPADLVGLTSLQVLGGIHCIPEPATFFLGLLAAGAWLLRHVRTNWRT